LTHLHSLKQETSRQNAAPVRASAGIEEGVLAGASFSRHFPPAVASPKKKSGVVLTHRPLLDTVTPAIASGVHRIAGLRGGNQCRCCRLAFSCASWPRLAPGAWRRKR